MIKMPTFIVATLLTGCVINGDKYDRPRDLSAESFVDRTRILAIRAEPPELSPGEQADISALLIDPNDEIENTLWVACSEEDATSFGCAIDFTGIDFTSSSPEELEEAGVIGFEPFLSPQFTAPEDALENLPEAERAEGTSSLVQAFAFPTMDGVSESFDFNTIESAFKRIVISEAATPNNNPIIETWTIDGIPVSTSEPVRVAPGASIEVGIVLDEATIESYTYLNSEGDIEQRTEEPYARWYTSGGSIDEEVTLYPYLDASVRTPETVGTEGTWWTVVRDRRGGIAWVSQEFIVQAN